MLTSSFKQGMYLVIPGDSVYSKNEAVQHTVTTGYGTDGRISSAGFTHGGAIKNFGYEYLSGSSLLHKLTMPNNMTLTQTYESSRDLLTGMAYHRGSTLVAQRTYTYDILGRPTARNTARNGQTVNDSFAHNSRSELAEATVSGREYEYTYDNIGNRQFALEGNKATMYDTNGLNQYTAIAENGAAAFIPQFDADGNQTLIKTATGIWSAVYNAENRPVSFSNEATGTVVECAYDNQGRRAYKKVTVNGNVALHQRYIYRGYLQIACCDLTRSGHPCLWLLTWDPTQPIATRPLAIRKDGNWFAYGWDLTKNICEVFGPAGYIRTTYTYSPFGQVTASGDVTQPILWSSEIWDDEPGLVYYNWRYYNATDGRWIKRDSINELFTFNLYACNQNNSIQKIDVLGNYDLECNEKHLKWYKEISVHFAYNTTINSITLCDDEMVSDIIKESVKDWSIETVKETFKQSELYKKLERDYKSAIQLIKKGSKYISLLGKSVIVSHHLCLVNFKLEVEGNFCCKKGRCYSFKKYKTTGTTKSSSVFLATSNGPRILKNHIDELPDLFYNVAQQLINQVKIGCNN